MNARGATGIILANVGLENKAIDEPTYVALVVMAIVTSLFAGPTMKACLGKNVDVSSH
jgi:Kef-type K+ transport system membrane component KefB